MRTWLRRVVLVLAACAWGLGCGSDESGEQGDTGPIEHPCADYASARCAAIERCASALFSYEYGTAASCQGRLAAWCNHVGSLSGVRAGPKAIGACANTFKDMSCEQWQSRRDDPLCSAPGGSLTTGTTCVDGYQCSSRSASWRPTACAASAKPPPSWEKVADNPWSVRRGRRASGTSAWRPPVSARLAMLPHRARERCCARAGHVR